MVLGVILEIRLNLRRKFVYVYVHYNCELLTLCTLATITSVCPELARTCVYLLMPIAPGGA